MRVLHIVPTYLPATRYGGPIYSVHGLCSGLARRGHDVEVYTTNVDGPGTSQVQLNTPVQRDGVTVTYFATSLGRRLYRSPAMAAALNGSIPDFDLVHLHSVFLWPTTAGAAAARSAGVPYVLSPRGMLVPELIEKKSGLIKKAWISLFERRNVAAAASVHVTSAIEGEDLARLGLVARRVDLIPNGFDLPSEASQLGDAENARRTKCEKAPVVLSLGRISWKKGLDRLIPAMQHVPRARLVVAGNDEEGLLPKLEALAMQAGVGDRVRFLGPVLGAAKWKAFASAEVFALPSYSENFGIAVLEAMACGVPVIVTPEVGIADAVAHAGAGLVVDGDPAAIGAAIAQLLADPDMRRRMGDAGRRVAVERFSWAAVAGRTEALYETLRSERGAAGNHGARRA